MIDYNSSKNFESTKTQLAIEFLCLRFYDFQFADTWKLYKI